MRVVLSVFVLSFAVAGCGVKGSCDRRQNGTAECEEVIASTITETVRSRCTSSSNAKERGAWAEKKACDRSGAIAACETNLDRTWYYPGEAVSKPSHVKQLCFSGKVLGADGKVMKDVVAEKLPVTTGNDPALEGFISAVRGPLEANVAAIEKLAIPTGAPAGGVRLASGKHVLAAKTVAAVYDDDLVHFTDLKAPYRKLYPLTDGDDFHACGLAVRTKHRSGKSDADMDAVLKWCSALTTLLVVKPTKLEAPVDKNDLTAFHSGVAQGTVTVFELPSGKVAGRYSFAAVSSDKVKSSQLDEDFRTNMEKALAAGLAKADPGATYTFGVLGSRD